MFLLILYKLLLKISTIVQRAFMKILLQDASNGQKVRIRFKIELRLLEKRNSAKLAGMKKYITFLI